MADPPTSLPSRVCSTLAIGTLLLALVSCAAQGDDGSRASPAETTPAAAAGAGAPDSTARSVASDDSVMPGRTGPADSGTVQIVTVLPANARVSVEGILVRGRSIRLPAGSYQISIIGRGFQPFTQRVTVRAGADVAWSPRLVTTTAAAGETPIPPSDTGARSRAGASCRTAMRGEDWPNAFTLCTAEANAGDPAASSYLGRLYERGQGTNRDMVQALVWYGKAAQGGDRDAQAWMGYALREGSAAKRDAAQSAKWFKLAAEAGDRSAQLEYGVALEKGNGTTRDERGARDWYRKAADQGNFMAARLLGRMMERGAGGAQSDSAAVVAYERAASLGDAESALLVGKRYRDGKGVAKSRERALEWFRKAAELGNAEAHEEVQRMQKSG